MVNGANSVAADACQSLQSLPEHEPGLEPTTTDHHEAQLLAGRTPSLPSSGSRDPTEAQHKNPENLWGQGYCYIFQRLSLRRYRWLTLQSLYLHSCLQPIMNSIWNLHWWYRFYTIIICSSYIGHPITFSHILSNITPPPEGSRFDPTKIQPFLSLAWLCFLVSLAVASLGSALLTFYKKQRIRDWDCELKDQSENGVKLGRQRQLKVQIYAVGINVVLGGFIVTAFILICLVVVAYQPIDGWISLGCTSFSGLVVAASICIEASWRWTRAPWLLIQDLWQWIRGKKPDQRQSDGGRSVQEGPGGHNIYLLS